VIVCVCNNKNDAELKEVIDSFGIQTLEQLQEKVDVCNCCLCCESCIEEIIDECRR
jgi:bacterioferritin-associated ferredoxin